MTCISPIIQNLHLIKKLHFNAQNTKTLKIAVYFLVRIIALSHLTTLQFSDSKRDTFAFEISKL